MWVGGALFLPPTCVCGVDSWRAGTHADQRGKVSREAPHAPGRCLGEPRAGEAARPGAVRGPDHAENTARGGSSVKRRFARKEASSHVARARGRKAREGPSVRPGRRALPTASLTRPGRDRAYRPRCWRTRCSGTGSSARGSRPRRGVRPRDESRARIG